MAFDKNMALRLAEPVEDAYMACVDRLIINIARHLGTGKAFRTAAWETAKLAKLGQLSAENAKIINEETRRVPEEIHAALDEVSKAALEGLEKAIADAIARGDLAQAMADSVQAMLQELQQQALDAANLVNTVMLDSGQSAYVQAINNTVMWQEQALDRQVAQAALNDAATSVTIGSETRRQALQKAISQLADSGIYGFVDRAGRHWSPEAYMGMDIRTTVHNAAIQSIRSRQQDYNSQIFQVSSHPGARPLCYPDDIQDKEANDRLYQQSQEQRALERSIRDAKRRQAAFKAAGLDDAAKDAGALIAQRQAAMRDFIARTGRVRRYDRESIRG